MLNPEEVTSQEGIVEEINEESTISTKDILLICYYIRVHL